MAGFGTGFAQGFQATSAAFNSMAETQFRVAQLQRQEAMLELTRRRMDQQQLQQLEKSAADTIGMFEKDIDELVKVGATDQVKRIGEALQQFVDINPSIKITNAAKRVPFLVQAKLAQAEQSTPEATGKAKGESTVAEGKAIAGRELTEAERSQMLPGFQRPLERDQKIAGLVSRGFTPIQATDIVDRNIQIHPDPLGRGVMAVNLVEGTIERIIPGTDGPAQQGGAGLGADQTAQAGDQQPAGQPKPKDGAKPGKTDQTQQQAKSPPEPASVFEAVEALGLVPAAQEVGSKVLGQVPGKIGQASRATSITRARQQIRDLREAIILAYAESDRPPVVQQARILESFPSMGALESPGHAYDMLTQIKANIEVQRDDDVRYANDPNNPADGRKKAFERARALSNVLLRMGAPKEKAPEGGDKPGGAGGWSIKRIQ